MKKHTFKLAAQNSIDEIDKLINTIKHKIGSNSKGNHSSIKTELEKCDLDKEKLIHKYNNLDGVEDNDWIIKANTFKESRDLLKDNLLEVYFSIES